LIQSYPHGFNDAAQYLDLVTALICKDLQKLTDTIAIASVPYDARSDQEWLHSIDIESYGLDSNERSVGEVLTQFRHSTLSPDSMHRSMIADASARTASSAEDACSIS
jgi:hypothetical protein